LIRSGFGRRIGLSGLKDQRFIRVKTIKDRLGFEFIFMNYLNYQGVKLAIVDFREDPWLPSIEERLEANVERARIMLSQHVGRQSHDVTDEG